MGSTWWPSRDTGPPWPLALLWSLLSGPLVLESLRAAVLSPSDELGALSWEVWDVFFWAIHTWSLGRPCCCGVCLWETPSIHTLWRGSWNLVKRARSPSAPRSGLSVRPKPTAFALPCAVWSSVRRPPGPAPGRQVSPGLCAPRDPPRAGLLPRLQSQASHPRESQGWFFPSKPLSFDVKDHVYVENILFILEGLREHAHKLWSPHPCRSRSFMLLARQSAHLPCGVEEGEPKISFSRSLPATSPRSRRDSGLILDSLIPNEVPHPDPTGPRLPFPGVEVFQSQGQRDAPGGEPWTAASLSEAGPRPARCLMSLQGQRYSSRADCVSSERVYLTNSGCTKSLCQPPSTANCEALLL